MDRAPEPARAGGSTHTAACPRDPAATTCAASVAATVRKSAAVRGPPPFGGRRRSGPAPFPPAAPVPQRWRRGLFIAIGILAVLAIGAGAFVVLSGDDPEFTFDGEEFAEPEATLLAAEESMEALVEERHGQLVDDSRCYFSSPGGDDVDRKSDVEDFLRCGPVLFVDDDPDAPWLRYPMEDREDSDGNLRLEPLDDPESQEPEALEDDEILRRPDDLEPPPNDGGIEAPDPPPGEPDLFEVNDVEGVDLDSIEAARIVSFTESIEVTAIGQPERIGRDDEARSAAEGQRLLAFEALLGLGEGDGCPRRRGRDPDRHGRPGSHCRPCSTPPSSRRRCCCRSTRTRRWSTSSSPRSGSSSGSPS